MKVLKKDNKEDYIATYIDVVSSLFIPYDKWLKAREREFLIHSVVIRSEGFNLKDTDAVIELKDRMQFRAKEDVYNYRNKLKKKGWLIQTKDDIILPGFFDRFKKKISGSSTFTFKLALNELNEENQDRENELY